MRQMEQSEGECVLTTTQHTCCIHLCNVVNNLFRVHSSVSLFALVLIASCINIQPTFLDTKQRLETIMSVHPKKSQLSESPSLLGVLVFKCSNRNVQSVTSMQSWKTNWPISSPTDGHKGALRCYTCNNSCPCSVFNSTVQEGGAGHNKPTQSSIAIQIEVDIEPPVGDKELR